MTETYLAPNDHNGGRSRWTEKIAEAVAREIVHDIVRRNLKPGTKLPPESEMLATYQLGRASLREALRILEVHGLILIRPGRGGGPVVANFSSRDFGRMATLHFHVGRATFRDLVQARMVMEPVMAGLAAQRVDDVAKDELDAALARMRSAMTVEDDDQYIDAAGAFHEVVAGLSGNRILDLVGLGLKHVYTERLRGMAMPMEQRTAVARMHERIAKAIVAGSAALAESLMREHMADYGTNVVERYPGLLDELVDWS